MKKQIEWLKKILALCADNIEISEYGIEDEMKVLETEYCAFSEVEKNSVYTLLNQQFSREDFIYILSFLIRYMSCADMHEYIMELLCEQEYDWKTGCMLELQTGIHVKGQYAYKRLFHAKNVKCYSELLRLSLTYLPIVCRNKKRIVIMTEEILTVLHAPTKVVINFAHILQKKLGFEVLLIACPCNANPPKEQWYKAVSPATNESLMENALVDYEYGGEIIKGCKVNMSEEALDSYASVLRYIHEWNPYFVFCMGMTNSIAELAREFTTLVSMGMTIKCPISEADILVRYTKEDDETEQEYLLSMKPNQKQIFMESNIPVIVEKNLEKFSRKELGLPKDKFLIAVVGNRLDNEIDEAFVEVLREILSKNEKIALVFIGAMDKVKRHFVNPIFAGRVFYLGYCRNLLGTYATIDLYLNPKRLGGGFSSAMALTAGIPVVTLPDCDVAYNVGEEFVVKSYDEMIELANNYVTDTEFYREKKYIAEHKGSENTEDKLEIYVRSMLDKISDIMENENDSI